MKKKSIIHTDPLTPAQEEFKAKLKELADTLAKAEHAYRSTLNKCIHVPSYHTPIKGDDCSTTWCDLCGKDLGWYCPNSPDHACHYYTEDGKIKLAGGVLVDVPDDEKDDNGYYDSAWETEDHCLFCGAPEERK